MGLAISSNQAIATDGSERLSLQQVDPADPRWLEFLSGRPDATPFHHPAWTLLLADVYGYHPLVFALAAADGSLRGGLPAVRVSSPFTGRRVVALPCTDHCPPLVSG